MRPIIRCDRCNRRLRNLSHSEGWNIVIKQGIPIGYICPDCQTPEENAEAVINEATLDYRLDDQGRVSGLSNAEDECVVCQRATDTGLGFRGEAEWIFAGLETLGLSGDQAMAVLQQRTGCNRGMVPDGEMVLAFRVCEECVAKCAASFKVGPVSSADGVPCYQPRCGAHRG